MKVYVASSWRNELQPSVVAACRAAGHETYDFKNPAEGDVGFSWRQLPGRPREEWDAEYFAQVVLDEPVAARGFELDMTALRAADACLLVLPCGRSAHLELGFAVGRSKLTIVLMPHLDEPELMSRMCDYVATSLDEALLCLSSKRPRPRWQADVAAYDARYGLTLINQTFQSAEDQATHARGPCRPYRHRECGTCKECWRHGACACRP